MLSDGVWSSSGAISHQLQVGQVQQSYRSCDVFRYRPNVFLHLGFQSSAMTNQLSTSSRNDQALEEALDMQLDSFSHEL